MPQEQGRPEAHWVFSPDDVRHLCAVLEGKVSLSASLQPILAVGRYGESLRPSYRRQFPGRAQTPRTNSLTFRRVCGALDAALNPPPDRSGSIIHHRLRDYTPSASCRRAPAVFFQLAGNDFSQAAAPEPQAGRRYRCEGPTLKLASASRLTNRRLLGSRRILTGPTGLAVWEREHGLTDSAAPGWRSNSAWFQQGADALCLATERLNVRQLLALQFA